MSESVVEGQGAPGTKGLKTGALGLAANVVIGVASTAPAYSLAVALGLAMAAVCLSSIGMANSYWSLVTLYALGMIGSGIYHPIGAASMGQFAAQLPGSRRAMGISVFHAAGMIGGIAGSIIATGEVHVGADGGSNGTYNLSAGADLTSSGTFCP